MNHANRATRTRAHTFGRIAGGLTLAVVVIAVAPGEAAAQTKITDAKFRYNGYDYFRGKAEDIVIAAYGQKKTPVTSTNYLAKQSIVKRDHLGKVAVKISGPYTIDWASFSNTDVNAGISYLTAAGGTASFSRTKAMNANLKLIKFAMGETPMKKLLNKYADGARKYLADEGADGRFVGEVWVVMDGSLATAVKNCGNVTGEGGSGFKVAIDVSSCSGSISSVDIPGGTTFAYALFKVKKWSSGKTKVEDLEDDQHGLN